MRKTISSPAVAHAYVMTLMTAANAGVGIDAAQVAADAVATESGDRVARERLFSVFGSRPSGLRVAPKLIRRVNPQRRRRGRAPRRVRRARSPGRGKPGPEAPRSYASLPRPAPVVAIACDVLLVLSLLARPPVAVAQVGVSVPAHVPASSGRSFGGSPPAAVVAAGHGRVLSPAAHKRGRSTCPIRRRRKS